ncbi:hypothetical protein B5S28_g4278 [[Candida] boidinii]|nr:hypothetical protein B5S28_g4278 [[Candida] boidinii]OWB75043.1 hypothetical protein B5S31_g4895 [[Candida] boidinii]OWB80725.1 hypothetical protein B5S32_g5022 [[Candida] boidinii]
MISEYDSETTRCKERRRNNKTIPNFIVDVDVDVDRRDRVAYQAEVDTVQMIFRRKTNANPESTVGLISMSGESVRVLSTLTTDIGRILSGLHDTKIQGQIQFITGIQVAVLALKNRQNKVQKQRVIVFAASPIQESEAELEKLAKKLKKNDIAVDVINFGETAINTSKLEKFISTVNNHDNSHLVTVSPGPTLLYEAVDRSPLFTEEGGSFGGFGGSDDFGFDDPNMDPELALALRLSMEEERARQERIQQEQQPAASLDTVAEESSENKDSEAK